MEGSAHGGRGSGERSGAQGSEGTFLDGLGRPGLGLLNPSRPGPAGMGDGAKELGQEGGKALPGLRGATRDSALGFEDTGSRLRVVGDWISMEGTPPMGFVEGWTHWSLGVQV